MKRVNYDSYRQDRAPELLRKRVALLNTFSQRQPRQRPRHPQEEALLGRLIRAKFRRLLESGDLVRVGPRRWRWRFPEFQEEKTDA